MSFFYLTLLIQGLSEALPISSSAHLLVLRRFFNNQHQDLNYDVALHMGSFLAFVVVFSPQLLLLLQELTKGCFLLLKTSSFSSSSESSESFWSFFSQSLGGSLVIGSLPIVVVGLLLTFFPKVHCFFRHPLWTVFFSLVFGSLFLFLDKLPVKDLLKNTHPSLYQGFLIGLFQVFALFPGASRLGCCITSSRFLGFSSPQSISYGFLLGIGALGGSLVLKAKDIYTHLHSKDFFLMTLGTFLISLPLVYMFSRWTGPLWIFGVYRLFLALLLFFLT